VTGDTFLNPGSLLYGAFLHNQPPALLLTSADRR